MTWEPVPGTELGGYLIASVIGRGGMATVYLAKQTALGRKVALKILSPELAEDEEFRRRFVHESRLAAGLDHPGVVPIYDAGEIEGLLFLAMRYVDGTDLKRLLERQITLSPERAIGLLSQIAAALDSAHAKGMVHRDVKPANILLERSAAPDEPDRAYLADFGLARSVLAVSSHTRPGTVYGTLDYMAPEQIEGRPVDGATDVYALGCVLYECLVGSPPFHRQTVVATLSAHLYEQPSPPSQVNANLSPGLDEVIASALAKDRTERLPSSLQLMEAAASALEAPWMPASAPSRAPLPVSNLPAQPTAFVGRVRELEDLTELLTRETPRLLTLIGPGGTGKTRLALEAAAKMLDRFPDGLVFVALTSIRDPQFIPAEIAKALGVREASGRSLEETLREHLASRKTLVVLDNFEQLLSGAGFVAELIAATAHPKFLVTSRAPLRLSGEQEYRVDPMSIPDPQRVASGMDLSVFEAIALFVERARAVSPGFALDSENASAVAEICVRLDGLPLAIELAAARTRLLTPQQMLPRLERRLAMLSGGARDMPARQQTLRATIDWSYELLTPADRQLFARLSVFAGGWTLEAAEAVCGSGGGGQELLDGLQSLILNSLVRREDTDGGSRFTMLDTVLEYASELLRDSEEFDDVVARHAEHMLSLAEEVDSALRGPDLGPCLERAEQELGNLRAAISSSLAQGRISLALRLVAGSASFFQHRGYWGEGRRWSHEVLTPSEDMRVPERAKVLRAAGSMSMFQGEIAAAASLLERAVELARVVGDKETLARSLTFLAWVRVVHGLDLERSTALGEEGVMVARNLGDAWVLAEALNTLGAAYGDQSYSPRSVSLLEESLQLRRSIEDIAGITDSLNNLGYLSVLGEDYPKAVAYLEESLELARRSADRPHIILAQDNLALAYLFDGEPALAEELFGETLRMCHEIGDKRIAEEALMGLAGVAALRHEWARAAWLAGASSGLAAVNELLPNDAETKIDEHYLSDARRALGDEVYKAEFEDGQRSSLEEAVAHALDETASA